MFSTKKLALLISMIGLVCVIVIFLKIERHDNDHSISFRTQNPSLGKIGYQIIIDRRRNGFTGNDLPYLPVRTSDKFNTKRTIAQWSQNRYALTQEEINFRDLHHFEKDRQRRQFESYTLRGRTYGGDFDGIIQSIPYLKKIGVDFIYINSPFQANTPMSYDTVNFLEIDKRYTLKNIDLIRKTNYNNISSGSLSDSNLSFIYLVNELHKSNIKIVVDVGFSYTSLRSFMFEDVVKNGINSQYRSRVDVFTGTSNPGIETKDSPYCKTSTLLSKLDLDYEIYYLPRRSFCETGPRLKIINNNYTTGYVDYVNKSIQNLIEDKFSLGYEGVDGIRVDVFSDLPDSFVKFLYDTFENNLTIIAEDWGSVDYNLIKRNSFHTVTNYEFRSLVEFMYFGFDTSNRDHITKFISYMIGKRDREVYSNWRNLLGSHDTSRIWSQLVQENQNSPQQSLTTKRDEGTKVRYQDGGKMNSKKPEFRNNINKIQAIIGLQLMFPGSMMIYYGDEVGMWGPDDPSNRQPMLRDDMKFDKQSLCIPSEYHYCDQESLAMATDLTINQEILNSYIKLNKLKKSIGSMPDQSRNLAFLNENVLKITIIDQNTELVYLYNFSTIENEITTKFVKGGQYTELRSDKTIDIEGGELETKILPQSSLLYFSSDTSK